MGALRDILIDQWRFLTFRPMGRGVRGRFWAYLAFGLVMTWLAGIGRYWDNPRSELWQTLGLGSVAYVLVLAGVLWAIGKPLRPANWTYRNVLLFVTLTAPPAILYAIPVERFLSLEIARAANVWFLAIVALWRVLLYGRFLSATARLPPLSAAVAMLLPLALIVTALSFLNLEHAVFEIMAGLDPDQGTSDDAAYQVVFVLSLFSVLGSPAIFLVYLFAIYQRWRA